MTPQPHHLTASYLGVDISDRLGRRPGVAPPPALEAARLVALAQRIAGEPKGALQALVELAMKVTSAHAAGVSLAESHGDSAVFRWMATAGELAPHLGATLPRWFSPCGDVLRKDALTLMREPVHHYPYIAELNLPIHEVLLAPFRLHGVPQGTVWAVSTCVDKSFDADDGRVLTELADFVTDSTELLERLQFGATR